MAPKFTAELRAAATEAVDRITGGPECEGTDQWLTRVAELLETSADMLEQLQ